jgi:hypothetical protein
VEESEHGYEPKRIIIIKGNDSKKSARHEEDSTDNLLKTGLMGGPLEQQFREVCAIGAYDQSICRFA